MSAPLPNASQDESNSSSHDQGLKRMKQAAERYRKAMASEKDRDRLIEDYLPLVKSIVSRMRHHFPDTYETEDAPEYQYLRMNAGVSYSFNQWLKSSLRYDLEIFDSNKGNIDYNVNRVMLGLSVGY